MSEREIQSAFRSQWDGWCSTVEFGVGGTLGFPDLHVLVGKRALWLPIELKLGELKGGVVLPREVRPAQVKWHTQYREAGGRSLLVIGTKNGDDDFTYWAVDTKYIRLWTSGFVVGTEISEVIPTRRDLGGWLVKARIFRAAELK